MYTSSVFLFFVRRRALFEASLDVECYAAHLLLSGNSRLAFGEAIHDHRRHTFAASGCFDVRRLRIRLYQLANFIIDAQNLSDDDASAVAGAETPLATDCLPMVFAFARG